MNIIQYKKCTECKIVKAISEFYKQKDGKYFVSGECKICIKKRNTKWAKNNRAKTNNYKKRWSKANPEKTRKQTAKWRREHPERNKENYTKWGKENPEKLKLIQQRVYQKRRQNPMNRINNAVRCRMWEKLKSGKDGKCLKELVNYTLADLKKHLEKQFTNGMTWENYGEWQIDHIIPIKVFNFTNIEHTDFKRCWALKNLQPLWKHENFTKHSKLKKPFQPSLLI